MRSAWRRSAVRATLATLLAAGLAPGCASAPPAPPAPPPPGNVFLLLRSPDGRLGAVTVENDGGAVTLDGEGQATAVRDARTPPEQPRTLAPDEIDALFGAALASAPAPPVHFILHFEQGSADLTPDSLDELPRILAAIRERASVDTSVVGHTDTLGDKDVNYQLSLERAAAVAALLEAAGVDPATLETTSHGEENLLVPTADEVAEPRNRRVEVTVR